MHLIQITKYVYIWGKKVTILKAISSIFVAGLFDEDYVFKESGVTYVC